MASQIDCSHDENVIQSSKCELSRGKAMEPSVTTGSPLVVLNPAANRGRMQQHRTLVRRKAAEEGAEYVETTRSGEAEELARQAASEGRSLIVVGGDGSVHEAVNGLLASG